MTSNIRRAVRALWFVVLCGVPLPAQSPTATLVGVVQDASGATVPGADIQVRNLDTSLLRQATSGADGGFTVANLAPGPYEVVVAKAGFQTLRDSALQLQVNQTARLELHLQVGTISESMEVKAQVALLNTENASKGDVIVTEEILEMPLDGRNFQDLAFLVPGVAPNAQGDNAGPFAINGARSDNTNFYLDGFSNRDPRFGGAQVSPNLDAMQEFKMETAGYSAEYGRLAGGVMSVVLKGGTNQLHGSLFEFLRNDRFDARNFFAADKNKLRRNQFGGLLSGPVRIPGLYNGRNRTFFLFSWESYRDATGNIQLSRVPTALERQGDFSQTADAAGKLVQVKDPLAANALFPGNRMPVSRLDPVSAKVLPYWPLPNQPLQANNYNATASSHGPWNSFLWKFDQSISSNDSFSIRYQRRTNGGDTPWEPNGSPLGTFGVTRDTIQHLIGLNATHLFSATVINEFRFSLSRAGGRTTNVDTGQNYPAELGISGTSTTPELMGFPLVKVSGLAALGAEADRPAVNMVNLYQWSDAVTWVHNRHQVRFGGEIVRAQAFQPYYTNTRGTFNFLGNWTSQPLPDFLLGLIDSASRQSTPPVGYLFSTDYAAFMQDDFKINPRLTLNIGLRYEIAAPQSDKYGRRTGFVPDVGKLIVADDRAVPNLAQMAAAVGLGNLVGVARDYGIPQSLAFTRYRNLAPRLGFAWRPFGGNATVLRGGYGIFNARSASNPLTMQMSNVFPWAINQTVNRVANNPSALSFGDAFKNASGAAVSVGGYDLHAPTQYLQSWNLTLERNLGRAGAIETAYAGSKGTHLGFASDINQNYYALDARLPNGSFPRPYPQINNAIQFFRFGANSIYNSGMATWRRRFTNGFFYRVNYVYAKSIDESSTFAFAGSGSARQIQNPRDLRAERGRSNYDVGHTFTMDFSYQIPWRRPQFGWLMHGWQVAGSGRAATGQPFTPVTSNFNLSLGGAVRPNRVASGKLANPTPERWFDLPAFPVVANGSYQYGTSGRNILDGPGTENINLSLHRNMRIRESGQLQFRWEAFNALNHTKLNQPNTSVNTVTGGTIAAAGASRSLQFGLRYQF